MDRLPSSRASSLIADRLRAIGLSPAAAALLGLAVACADEGPVAPAPLCPSPPAEPPRCEPTIQQHEPLESPHVTDLDGQIHNSNPPSSGPHCFAWPRWGLYDEPLSRCHYLHGLEHGAVAVLYAPTLACAANTSALEELARAFRDPRCGKARLVYTPDPLLPPGVAVAAAAWGWTFTAPCFNADVSAALAQFLVDHAGQAPEDVCSEGTVGSPR